MAEERRKRQEGTDSTTGTLRERESEAGNALVPVTARGEATRRRILDAAEEVFGAKGYYAASVTEITQRAQVAQGTFYLYFHSKQEIFLKLVEDLGARMRVAMSEGSRGSGSRLARERDGFQAFFAFASAHQQLFRIVQEADRLNQPTFQEYYAQLARPYARRLREAMEAGEIRQMDPEALAYALIGIGHFLALRWLIWPNDEQGQLRQDHANGNEASAQELPERVFTMLLDFLAHGLKP
ncbi:MAG TPA: TetR/AcrR family transcriptional regulator [Ktedonobacterales bacterium]|nr:TetR/AcrR family transcriptional regulator [Ktedonobacterales bacterium]